MTLLTTLRRLASDRRGISTVEYGILIAVVGVGLYAALGTVPTKIGETITKNVESVTTAAPKKTE